jgi:hypothetical protein
LTEGEVQKNARGDANYKACPLSLAELFSIYYAFWGFVYGLTYMIYSEGCVACTARILDIVPAKLDIAFHAHTNMLSGISLTFWATACFAVTGWVSGLIGAFIFNLCSRVFGLQLQRQSETESNRATPD